MPSSAGQGGWEHYHGAVGLKSLNLEGFREEKFMTALSHLYSTVWFTEYFHSGYLS